ncbi:Nramp family divalent metal transporter [Candidatus Laterigemmans baculatus]|nr:Nramp family divalent metal transporter [Candidatus Laterigemmans baculatus]
MLRFAGPGMIVAGSIVGSGELIATTKTGAEAGFVLLWLIILGCVVKVFAQVELGRYTLISGKTTLDALTDVPGPRIAGRGNWLVWYWFLMWICSISQLGGIVGGVGEALAISLPVTQMGRDYNAAADAGITARLRSRVPQAAADEATAPGEAAVPAALAALEAERAMQRYTEKYSVTVDGERRVRFPADVAIWATIVAAGTSILLAVGRYGLIQSFSTVLVGSFTVLVIVNLYFLQEQPEWRVRASEFWSGLAFRLPQSSEGLNPIRTALATFGIIGVGAAELVTYPYWCLERGYARFTGPNDGSEAWTQRARGWMRVMRVDAWGSAIVYTFSTVAFFLLGAAVLHRSELNPGKDDMVRTLAAMFVPVFSDYAAAVFLFGAVAVLYSTFFVANASHARVFTDALRVMGLIEDSPESRQRWVVRLSGFFPVLCLVIYLGYREPAQLVLISGVAQGIMLPMLAAAALYFRYRRTVEALRPGSWWDALLWISAGAMLVTGAWTIYDRLTA